MKNLPIGANFYDVFEIDDFQATVRTMVWFDFE
jgi:hypothetical protein